MLGIFRIRRMLCVQRVQENVNIMSRGGGIQGEDARGGGIQREGTREGGKQG